MAENLARRLIREHLIEGDMEAGQEIGIQVDQVLVNDASGPLVMLELEAMGLDRVQIDPAVAYMDHLVVQEDNRNADDHRFLLSAAQRFGLWYGRPGQGVAHPVHQQRFGVPGATLLGGDSHTPAAGSLGMLAIGAGGVAIAAALAGEPFRTRMPKIWGIELTGELPPFVSAKDVILELLRRHGVDGGAGRIIEYRGSALGQLTCMDRHVIANMGTELGATTTVFPSDQAVRQFLTANERPDDWIELRADKGATYDIEETIDLSELVPLIAMPSSPGNVVPVSEVAGRPIQQAYIGSSANPGYRDLAVAAWMVAGRMTDHRVSFDINPASRQVLATLVRDGHLLDLVQAGARVHQTGCNGCIGMGQAPSSDQYSLRTVPRNFPGRSGTSDDAVCLVSPETATASALTGVITDPRTLDIPVPDVTEPPEPIIDRKLLVPPLPREESRSIELDKGPAISSLPELGPLPDELRVPVLLVMDDDVSTDEILPAGADAMSSWSNIDAMADLSFERVDASYRERARSVGAHAVVAGRNYGQGSSREHAVLAPRTLGLRLVIAASIARIHWENLVSFGVLPLLADVGELGIQEGDVLVCSNLHRALSVSDVVEVEVERTGETFSSSHGLSARQVRMLLAGGLVNSLAAGQSVQPD